MPKRDLTIGDVLARASAGSYIPPIVAGLMRQFGHSREAAEAIARAKSRRAGKLRAAKYARHAAPKGGTLR